MFESDNIIYYSIFVPELIPSHTRSEETKYLCSILALFHMISTPCRFLSYSLNYFCFPLCNLYWEYLPLKQNQVMPHFYLNNSNQMVMLFHRLEFTVKTTIVYGVVLVYDPSIFQTFPQHLAQRILFVWF